jgi:protein involved in plasmid replication-relaxation
LAPWCLPGIPSTRAFGFRAGKTPAFHLLFEVAAGDNVSRERVKRHLPMDHDVFPARKQQLPRYRRVTERAIPIAIQPRDLVLLKLVYEFPYSTAAHLSRLLPAGSINPQLRAYHDGRTQELAQVSTENGQPAKVRRAVLRRLQQLFHAAGGPYVQRHQVDNNSPVLYTIAMRAVDLLAAEFDLDAAALARSARNRDPGEKFIAHARQRMSFRFAMTVAVASRPDIEIAYWHKDGSVRIPVTYQADDGTIVEDTIIPDDMLGIRWLKSGLVEPLFGESDKRKDYPRVGKKMLAYEHLLRQIKAGTATLPLAPPHVVRQMQRTRHLRDGQRVYMLAGQPIVNFRVLWVARTQRATRCSSRLVVVYPSGPVSRRA